MIKELQQKLIKFGEGELLGIKDEEGKLWLGIRKVCNDLGLTEGQANRQVNNISDDLVFEGNYTKFDMVQTEGNRKVNREVLCINENIITLWLAKIKLTPIMQKENPKAVAKLIDYQLRCAKVLHEAFFENEEKKEKFYQDLGLKGQIVKLENEVSQLKYEITNNTEKLTTTQNTLDSFIDVSTINSYQASKLLKQARDRVSTILGGAHSKLYKTESRKYFKNLWLNVAEKFSVASYKDLNPLVYGSASTFISNWSYK